jgi:hypothetical protein
MQTEMIGNRTLRVTILLNGLGNFPVSFLFVAQYPLLNSFSIAGLLAV